MILHNTHFLLKYFSSFSRRDMNIVRKSKRKTFVLPFFISDMRSMSVKQFLVCSKIELYFLLIQDVSPSTRYKQNGLTNVSQSFSFSRPILYWYFRRWLWKESLNNDGLTILPISTKQTITSQIYSFNTKKAMTYGNSVPNLGPAPKNVWNTFIL